MMTGEVIKFWMPDYNFVCCREITSTPITNCNVAEADSEVFIVKCRRWR